MFFVRVGFCWVCGLQWILCFNIALDSQIVNCTFQFGFEDLALKIFWFDTDSDFEVVYFLH